MSIPYEVGGRTRQKARTREAMLAATRELLAEGVLNPTVEQAADRAQVSRTTAYRYFPNQHALLIATYPNLDSVSLLGESPPEDPLLRVDLVTKNMGRQIVENEPELRTMLRLSLEAGTSKQALPLRQGRFIRWLEDALSPLAGRMAAAELHRLALSIRAATGIEAFVWLTDIGGVSRKQALALMRTSAQSLLRCALADAGITAGLAPSAVRP